jgi:hypothetical protein
MLFKQIALGNTEISKEAEESESYIYAKPN